MENTKPKPEKEVEAIKPERYRWKKSYTFVLLANIFYVIFFYFLMKTFT